MTIINRSAIVIAFTCLLFSHSAYSIAAESSSTLKKIEFDISGKKIGDKLTNEFLNQYCLSKTIDNEFIECKQRTELKGISISLLYFYYKNELVAISMVYPSEQYENITKIYSEKFEALPAKKDESILVGDSVEFINKLSSWDTESGKFIIEKYNTGFNQGIAYIKSGEYEKYVENEKEEFEPGMFKKIFGDILD